MSDLAYSPGSRSLAVTDEVLVPTELPYRRVVVVFNPHSTGDAEGNARRLAAGLSVRTPQLPVQLVGSRYPGHAVELARTAAMAVDGTLVVSASGDGGFHEVVNGVLQAVAAGHRDSFAAVLASGNANDHAGRSHRPLIDAIVAGRVARQDVLAFEVEGRPVHYAHSYIGVGLSAVVVNNLNRHPVGRVREVWSATVSLARHHPVRIVRGGVLLEVDSLVFANIDRMAKYLAISSIGSPSDGRYEVILTANQGRPALAANLLRALTGHLSPPSRYAPYHFTLLDAAPVQLDGEVVELAAGARITVSCHHHGLLSVH